MSATKTKPSEARCPKCGEHTTECWQRKRMLARVCKGESGCGWQGKPYFPPKKPVRTVKTIGTGHSWEFEGFDRYGHTYMMSRGYGSKEECENAAREDVARQNRDPDMAPCSAIVWPPTTTVRGTLIRAPRKKNRGG